jgi:hypothetical protein
MWHCQGSARVRPGILFATSTGNIHCIGPGDDHSVPQQRSEGTSYNSVALERSRHIAWFEAVKIMSLRSHFAKYLLRTCGKSTLIFQEATATPTMAITAGKTPRVKPEARRKGEAGTLFGRLMSSDGVRLAKAECQGVSDRFWGDRGWRTREAVFWLRLDKIDQIGPDLPVQHDNM